MSPTVLETSYLQTLKIWVLQSVHRNIMFRGVLMSVTELWKRIKPAWNTCSRYPWNVKPKVACYMKPIDFKTIGFSLFTFKQNNGVLSNMWQEYYLLYLNIFFSCINLLFTAINNLSIRWSINVIIINYFVLTEK